MKKNIHIIPILSIVLFLFSCQRDAHIDIPVVDLVTVQNTEISLVQNSEVHVSADQASDIAATFFGRLIGSVATKGGENSHKEVLSTEVITDSNDGNTPMMYVINFKEGGFVVVSATRDYYPVLAYSDKNLFIFSESMGGVVVWIEESIEAIRQSKSLDEDTRTAIRKMWMNYEFSGGISSAAIQTRSGTPEDEAYLDRTAELYGMMSYVGEYNLMSLSEAINWLPSTIYSNLCSQANALGSPLDYTIVGVKEEYITNQVGPLLTTQWNQDSPYNGLCPNNYPAGCVAIAMAQIMKFHQYPTNYNWSNMPPYTATTDTQELIRDIGSAVDMQYGQNGSHPPQIFPDNYIRNAYLLFNYHVNKASHNNIDVENELFNENRPVHMGGYVNSTLGIGHGKGHDWVCDGAKRNSQYERYFVEFLIAAPGNSYQYRSMGYPSFNAPEYFGNPHSFLYFNINWGWGGVYDDWFISNNVNSGNGNYQYGRTNFYAYPN